MNLGKQVDSLLRRQAAVYIKGLGVFKRTYTAATFDTQSNAFLPPLSFIEFDASATDGYDLIYYIQQAHGINKQEAENVVLQAVEVIKETISGKGFAEIDHLGTLVDFDGTYIFKPFDLSGFLYNPVENDYPIVALTEEDTNNTQNTTSVPENIFTGEGLESVQTPPSDNSVRAEQASSSIVSNTPTPRSIIEEEPTPREESKSYIYGLVAAVFLLILGGVYFYISVYQSTDEIERDFTFESSTSDSTDLSLLEEQVVDTAAILQNDSLLMQEDTVSTTKPISPVVEEKPLEQPLSSDFKYTIVIGTHVAAEQAEAEVQSYHKKGYKTVRALPPSTSKNKTRVVWDIYKTIEDRDAALREVRKNIKSDAWGANI